MGRRAGTIDAEEGHAIENILSLKEKTVQQVMTPRTVMYTLSSQQNVSQVLEMGVSFIFPYPYLRRWRYGRSGRRSGGAHVFQHSLPIWSEGHRHDIFSALAAGREDTLIQDLGRPADFTWRRSANAHFGSRRRQRNAQVSRVATAFIYRMD